MSTADFSMFWFGKDSDLRTTHCLFQKLFILHGGYPLQIFSDQICVPYCFSLTQQIFVAEMDVSLQGSDENSIKGDRRRYSLFYFILLFDGTLQYLNRTNRSGLSFWLQWKLHFLERQ